MLSAHPVNLLVHHFPFITTSAFGTLYFHAQRILMEFRVSEVFTLFCHQLLNHFKHISWNNGFVNICIIILFHLSVVFSLAEWEYVFCILLSPQAIAYVFFIGQNISDRFLFPSAAGFAHDDAFIIQVTAYGFESVSLQELSIDPSDNHRFFFMDNEAAVFFSVAIRLIRNDIRSVLHLLLYCPLCIL